MPQSFASLHCHIIFSTKNREPLLTPEFMPRLFEYMGGIVRERDNPLLAAGGITDHVHLLVSMNRQISVCDIVRDIKSVSSGWIHQTF